ncbi:MAG: glycosyltransferase [Dehalococcoidia bacterium]
MSDISDDTAALKTAELTPHSLEAYRPIIGGQVDELRALAAPLRGARVLHLNSTSFGGGVAEILATLVPLLNDMGIESDWKVIHGKEEFFAVTKAMHNLLQGMPMPWTPAMRDTWLRYNEINARLLRDEDYDFVWIHDPQPLGVLQFLDEGRKRRGAWIWRCHIDLSDANRRLWGFLRPFVERYDAAVFTLQQYVRDGLVGPQVFIAAPAIDPLSAKNRHLPPAHVRQVMKRHGIDTERPYMIQVSRFDPWKDPLGVIDAYRLVKKEIPQIQLVMAATLAHDDPEGWLYFDRTARKAGDDQDIRLVNGNVSYEVNALQRGASVVLQLSTREGFGLVVTEALWKARPMVARGVGGIPLQVLDGQTGHIVDSVDQAASRTFELLTRPAAAKALGARAREHVRQNFLITRYLRDHLNVMQAVAASPGRNGHSGPAPAFNRAARVRRTTRR